MAWRAWAGVGRRGRVGVAPGRGGCRCGVGVDRGGAPEAWAGCRRATGAWAGRRGQHSKDNHVETVPTAFHSSRQFGSILLIKKKYSPGHFHR